MPHSISRAEEFIVWCVKTGVFQIRDDGTIWRLCRFGRTGRVIPLSAPVRADKPRTDGYCQVNVLKGYRAKAHRIVWIMAHGAPPPDVEINHKNGHRCQNDLGNLELATKGENLQHAYDVLGRSHAAGARNGRAKLEPSQVQAIRERNAAGEAGRALAREFGVSHTTIQAIVSGRLWRDELPQVLQVA